MLVINKVWINEYEGIIFFLWQPIPPSILKYINSFHYLLRVVPNPRRHSIVHLTIDQECIEVNGNYNWHYRTFNVARSEVFGTKQIVSSFLSQLEWKNIPNCSLSKYPLPMLFFLVNLPFSLLLIFIEHIHFLIFLNLPNYFFTLFFLALLFKAYIQSFLIFKQHFKTLYLINLLFLRQIPPNLSDFFQSFYYFYFVLARITTP